MKNRFSTSARAFTRRQAAPGRLAAAVLLAALAACGGGGGDSGGGDDTSGGTATVPTTRIAEVSSDTLTQPGAVPSGGRTDDTTPTLEGRLSKALTTGQTLRVYDGDVLLADTATVSGTTWTLTPATALAEGEHRFSAEVMGADGRAGARSAPYAVNVALVRWDAVDPVQAVRRTPTTLSFGGSGWPSLGWTVQPLDDPDARCDAPMNVNEVSLQVNCQFHLIGQRKLALQLNGQTVAEPSVTVASNVTGVTWSTTSSPAFATPTVLQGEAVQFKVSGTQLLEDGDLSITVGGCVSRPTEVGTPSATERVYGCTMNGSASPGRKDGTLRTPGTNGLVLAAWQVPVDVPPVPAPPPLLAHTGMTAAQCQTGNFADGFVPCSSASALALNGQQDGHRAGVNAMSFSRVGSYSLEECVMDNVSGLVWEGKTSTGMRSGDTLVFGGNLGGNPALGFYTIADYLQAVNQSRLCGYSDWRLPTAQELLSIVNYSIASPGPTVDTAWLPNTAPKAHKTSEKLASDPSREWLVYFQYGLADVRSIKTPEGEYYLHSIRLVRGSP